MIHSKSQLSAVAILAIQATILLPGCAVHPPKADPASALADPARLSDSSVDINYVLGHAHRRFMAQGKDSSFKGQTFLDRKLLKENDIDQGHYSTFLGKATQFIATPHRLPAEQNKDAIASSSAAPTEDSCRCPFTVTVRIGADTQSVHGCRAADDGALSHLVRDGEFLLFSRK
jgi:hypothetical protein